MSELSLKSLNDNKLDINGTAVDAQTVNGLTVETAVPIDAVFTDTITTINGKTGSIQKSDILALGLNDIGTSTTNGNIKVNGTETAVYTHPGTHPSSIITGLANVATSGNAADINFSSTNFTSTKVSDALNELFQNASNGKNSIASAITGKGISASGSDTFTTLATKITSIQQATGNAVAAQVLSGYTFSNSSGTNISGTMVNNGSKTFTPTSNNQTSGAGYYSGITVNGVSVPAANVLTGTTIAGVAGTMANRGAPTWIPTTNDQVLSSGYYSGGTVKGDSNLVASNILSGVSIFGVAGSAINGVGMVGGVSQTFTLTYTQGYSYDYVNSGQTFVFYNLSFTPSKIFGIFGGGSSCSVNGASNGGTWCGPVSNLFASKVSASSIVTISLSSSMSGSTCTVTLNVSGGNLSLSSWGFTLYLYQ